MNPNRSETMNRENARLVGLPMWKAWIIHHGARAMGVQVKVEGVPFGARWHHRNLGGTHTFSGKAS